jgi:hypothetical protein
VKFNNFDAKKKSENDYLLVAICLYFSLPILVKFNNFDAKKKIRK